MSNMNIANNNENNDLNNNNNNNSEDIVKNDMATVDKKRIVEELLGYTASPKPNRTLNKDMPQSPTKRLKANRMKEKEEDQQLVEDELHLDDIPHTFHSQPSCIKGGEMRSYQVEALNWLIALFDENSNGILADEMGLGKTLETISILGYLKQYRNINGPHLIIVPKSTSSNWVREIQKWCPSLSVFKYHGMKDERKDLRDQLGKTDVCITTYEIVILDKAQFRKVKWEYIIIDEAHRIKNEKSKLSEIVRILHSNHRILVTGTPLQNNLHELWALLNFLLPKKFPSAEEFTDTFDHIDGDDRDKITAKLHKILRRYMLRRLKTDVEKDLPPKTETKLFIGLSDMQKNWYRKILTKDVDILNAKTGKKMRLLNILMQLRKVCNHPYLFHGAEEGPPYVEGEHIIENSGKVLLLDKLLKRLKERGSRVLIFSQMTRMLDILEDYCWLRQWEYCRIDGSTKQDDRDEMMDSYNSPNSSKFIFLLSTRAGGLGINLQTADTVILFDSDWNPQMDLQAQDRAHRIGQKRPVHVYRFVTEGTCEEKLVQRATEKLFLDALVIQAGRLKDKDKQMSSEEVQKMVRFGAQRIFEATDTLEITDEDIDAIITRGEERTAEENEKLKTRCDYNLLTFSMPAEQQHTSVYQYEGQDYRKLQNNNNNNNIINNKDDDEFEFIQLPQRQSSKKTYNINSYYREALRVGESKAKKEYRPPTRYEWQFYNIDKLEALERRHYNSQKKYKQLIANYKKKNKNNNSNNNNNNNKEEEEDKDDENVSDNKSDDNDSSYDDLTEEERLEKFKIKANVLTEKELSQLEKLQNEGFDWKKTQFTAFLRAMENYGRDNLKEIKESVPDKSPKEVEEYYYTFWENINELSDKDTYLAAIERGEAKIDKQNLQKKALNSIYKQYKDPKNELQVPYPRGGGSKAYNEEEDRFLICMLYELGYGYWAEIKRRIHLAWQFRFDWHIKTRSEDDIRNRCNYLLKLLEKSYENSNNNKNKKGKRKQTKERKPVERPNKKKKKN